jgi:hypothetical protein
MTSNRRSLAVFLLAAAAFLFLPALTHTQETEDQLEQLVAPVALYPDDLLANVLAAATFPSEIDDAAQWLQQNASLSSDQVAQTVDRLDWDDSIKALTEFPAVVSMMNQNLSWTSALGDAYYNEPDSVMDAVQALRRRAKAAGTLQSNAQITIIDSGGIISIEPAATDDVYVPAYDAWGVYGAAIAPWPNYVFAPGIVRGAHVVWGVHVRIGGAWTRVRWGGRNWNVDWHGRRVLVNRQPFVSHSPTAIDRRPVVRTTRTPAPLKPTAAPKPSGPPPQPSNPRPARGFPEQRPATPPSGTHSGAINANNPGGVASHESQRGQASMGARPAPSPRAAPPPRTAAPPPKSAPPPTGPGRTGRGRGGRP